MSASATHQPHLLHLTDALAGESGLCAFAASTAGLPAFHHRLWLIAGPSLRCAATALGLSPHHSHAPPLNRPELAWPALRRLAQRSPPPAAALCWSPATARLARLIFPSSTRIIAPRILTTPTGTSLPPPADPLPAISPATRTAARTRMGLSSSNLAILHLPDAPATSDIAAFTRRITMTATAGRPLVGLVPESSPAQPLARAARFLAATGTHCRLLRFSGTLVSAAFAADAVVWDQSPTAPEHTPPAPSALAFAAALAASGVPILAAPTPAAHALLGHAPGPLLSRGHGEHHWADLLANFADNPAACTAAARANAASLAARQPTLAFCHSLQALLAPVQPAT